MILAWLATLALLIGACCLYLATPHQVLVTAPMNDRALRRVGFAGLGASLILLLLVMGAATAVFTWTVGIMLLWSVPPIVLRWLRYRREDVQ